MQIQSIKSGIVQIVSVTSVVVFVGDACFGLQRQKLAYNLRLLQKIEPKIIFW